MSDDPPEQPPLIISVHGIRTSLFTRGWQEEMEDRSKMDGADLITLHYGFFPALLFVLPWMRTSRVEWFKKQWTRIRERHGNRVPSVIAHSFGTYLVAEAMRKYPQMQYEYIVFCGSIVQQDFPWQDIHPSQFRVLLNQHGGLDFWAGFVQWAVRDAGPSGRHGFNVNEVVQHAVRQESYPGWDHGDYFYEENYDRWLSFVRGKEAPPIHPARGPGGNMLPLLLLLIIVMFVIALAWLLISGRLTWSQQDTPTRDTIAQEATPPPLPTSRRPGTTSAGEILANSRLRAEIVERIKQEDGLYDLKDIALKHRAILDAIMDDPSIGVSAHWYLRRHKLFQLVDPQLPAALAERLPLLEEADGTPDLVGMLALLREDPVLRTLRKNAASEFPPFQPIGREVKLSKPGQGAPPSHLCVVDRDGEFNARFIKLWVKGRHDRMLILYGGLYFARDGDRRTDFHLNTKQVQYLFGSDLDTSKGLAYALVVNRDHTLDPTGEVKEASEEDTLGIAMKWRESMRH